MYIRDDGRKHLREKFPNVCEILPSDILFLYYAHKYHSLDL
jgi:hypothetical protein